MTVRVRYFAVLRDRAGQAEELYSTEAMTAGDLVLELIEVRKLGLSPALIRPAIGGQFVEAKYSLSEGDEVILIPPVAGG
jgi:molybdopterin converting factor small subunit